MDGMTAYLAAIVGAIAMGGFFVIVLGFAG